MIADPRKTSVRYERDIFNVFANIAIYIYIYIYWFIQLDFHPQDQSICAFTTGLDVPSIVVISSGDRRSYRQVSNIRRTLVGN